MIVSFQGRIVREIWARNGSDRLPRNLWLRAKALLTIMHASHTLDDLRIQGEPPTIRSHKLHGDQDGRWSITLRLPWCITFKFRKGEFSDVTIENYH